MTERKSLLFICLTGLFIFIISFVSAVQLYSQDQAKTEAPEKKSQQAEQAKNENGISLRDWIALGLLLVAVVSLSINVYLLLQRRKHKKQDKVLELEAAKEFAENEKKREAGTAAEMYTDALKEELGTIHLLGSPDLNSPAVKLEDAFVSLCISETWHSGERVDEGEIQEKIGTIERERFLSPEEVMKRAFQKFKLLLVIGDPGSGKTTLLKYYAMTHLDKTTQKLKQLGFTREILPIYFPLRELEFNEDDEPASLTENLAKWCDSRFLNVPAQQFQYWLKWRRTLVLLDGLDEISSKKRRQKVCKWIKRLCVGYSKACFVVASRATGYRKLDGIELELPHLRADIMDFSSTQQEAFLRKWFRAVFLSGLPPVGVPEQQWRRQQKKKADQRSGAIIEFLKDESNKAVQELAAVPMLLQIIAIIWKERKHLPRSRPALYDAALNYLLDYRDREREIKPLLPVEGSRCVLAPTALWMQEELEKDEAPKEAMHQTMQAKLNTLAEQPPAAEFCEYLRDRAGLIADYDRDHYVFRHKSFREFLAALQLREDSHQTGRLETLIDHFGENWWEEPLRFFMSKSNDTIFDRFMRLFFQSPVSEQLDAHQQTLLQHLVREAPQKKIDALVEWLNSEKLNPNRRRYVMDCLKTIDTPEAFEAVNKADKSKMDKSSRDYAEDIVAEASAAPESLSRVSKTGVMATGNSFRNPLEDNVEYIKIPGGTYKYSLSGEMAAVPDLYFCKYPVTNKRYRRFIAYLAGKEKELLQRFPLNRFTEKLAAFAETIKGYNEYLGNDAKEWREKLRSRLDDDKRFNGDDQPVVGVTWFAARSYCFWLSCLEAVLSNTDMDTLYRLPTEEEWEWAAGGEPDGSVRQYPWPKEKGEPHPNLANYGKNVGATTPVGRYPEGATPHGLMDMAGNVWEWMDNYYDRDEDFFALRGGSWYSEASALRCSARFIIDPPFRINLYGFRVRLGSAPSHKLKL